MFSNSSLFFFFNLRSLRFVGGSLQNFATWSEASLIYKCLSKNLGAKKIGHEKHTKFGPISDPFSV